MEDTGVKLTKKAMQAVETQLQRLPHLDKWFMGLMIAPMRARANQLIRNSGRLVISIQIQIEQSIGKSIDQRVQFAIR
jgi:hypothetical protein